MVVIIRGSDYFRPDLIDLYPAALLPLPHVIGIRDPAHRAFDFSRFRSVQLVECVTVSSTEIRQRLKQYVAKRDSNDGCMAVESYCFENRLYI